MHLPGALKHHDNELANVLPLKSVGDVSSKGRRVDTLG